MQILVNGEKVSDLPVGMTVTDLIKRLELPEKKIAIERNLEIVPKSQFTKTLLCDQDRLEIIHFIGGG